MARFVMKPIEKVPVVIQVTLSTCFPYNSVAVSRIGPSFAMPSDSHESIKNKPWSNWSQTLRLAETNKQEEKKEEVEPQGQALAKRFCR